MILRFSQARPTVRGKEERRARNPPAEDHFPPWMIPLIERGRRPEDGQYQPEIQEEERGPVTIPIYPPEKKEDSDRGVFIIPLS